jgi:RimJ/RimL family protein N-acetyltransferase
MLEETGWGKRRPLDEAIHATGIWQDDAAHGTTEPPRGPVAERDGTSRQPIRPVTLADDVVSLEPLRADHAEALFEATSGPRDTYVLARVPDTLAATRAYIELMLAEEAQGTSVAFVTRDARSGHIVGSTRFMSIERWTWPTPFEANRRPAGFADAVEIGSTWITPAAQRTGINTHAKLLMLTHAFEVWGVRRVTLKTDARNHRSRAAIARIGGQLDGILRSHMPAVGGEVRDTAYFSILAKDWAEVKVRLVGRARASG